MFKEFKNIDIDNDGFITKQEFLNSNTFKNNPLPMNILNNIIDNDDKIDFSEFVECVQLSLILFIYPIYVYILSLFMFYV